MELFARSLAPDDKVVLEATGNAFAIARVLEPHVGEVVVANPRRVRAISHAKVKSDQFDARTLAELLAADLLDRVWIPDEQTRVLRRLSKRRLAIVVAIGRRKAHVFATLQRNLYLEPKASTCSASAVARGSPRLSCRAMSVRRSLVICVSSISSRQS